MKQKTCLGMSYRVRQGFTLFRASSLPLPFYSTEKVDKKKHNHTHFSYLQLQGIKQVVCEFDPHPGGWKKNLNFSASWWCIAVQMNRKIGRETATLIYVYTTALERSANAPSTCSFS